MEEGKVLLIGNESDVLHCGYIHPINEGGKRYPSVDHYAFAMILGQLGLEEVHVLELLATPSSDVSRQAMILLQKNMPQGHDMNSLSQYLSQSRQSYTMLGLRARATQDKRFRQTLMATGDALLIVCDARDSELGIGMDEEHFLHFTRRCGANAERISQWMQDNRLRPPEIGQNQLGFFLMWLRYELKEKERSKWLGPNEIRMELTVGGGDTAAAGEKPAAITVADFVIALEGIFQPLSNYYAMNLDVKGDIYRSVEHYAFQRLFEALRLSYNEVMKIRTTVKPVDVQKVAQRVIRELKIDESEVVNKSNRLGRWRQSAMKQKFTKNEYLQRLLLSTGHALLIDTTTGGDPTWCAGTDEFELQHLLTKKYVNAETIVNWMSGKEQMPGAVSHLGTNKAGLFLMEIRTKLSAETTRRICLAAPLPPQQPRPLSAHMICFTPESVFHPFHAAEIKIDSSPHSFPSAAHFVAHMAMNYFNMNKPDREWIGEAEDPTECWERLYQVIHEIQPPIERLHTWFWSERQNHLRMAIKLQFEQHPRILRVLLDTGEALLVGCQRFSSMEAELYIGMRERDFRMLCSQVRLDTKQIMDICTRPMAFRPNFFGGNRLGIMLMDIRREFLGKGVVPHHIPELPLPPDALLGSDSAMENYVPHYHFNIFDPLNYSALWANPLLLMLKKEIAMLQAARSASSSSGEREKGADATDTTARLAHLEELWTRAVMTKRPPTLVSHDDVAIERALQRMMLNSPGEQTKGGKDGSAAVEGINENTVGALDERQQNGGVVTNGKIDDVPSEDIDIWKPEILRAVFRKLTVLLRGSVSTLEDIKRVHSAKVSDCKRIQELRQSAERLREKALENKLPPHPLPGDLPPPPQAMPPSQLHLQLNQAVFGPGVFGGPGADPHQQRIQPLMATKMTTPPPPQMPSQGPPPPYHGGGREHHHHGGGGGGRPDGRRPMQDGGRDRSAPASRNRWGSGGGTGGRRAGGFPQQQQQRGHHQGGGSGGPPPRRQRSRDDTNGGDISPVREPLSSSRKGSSSEAPSIKPEPREPAAEPSATAAAPAPKKPKREVREEELSEGEILSSDDD